MSKSLTKWLIVGLTDWLIVLCGASILVWFMVTQPVIPPGTVKVNTAVEVTKLEKHVRQLTVSYAPRNLENGNLENTARYIHKEFDNFGDASFQKIQTLAGKYSNVILQLGPNSQEVLVIGAHYDAKNNSTETEGNASGIATLIELARVLSLDVDNLGIKVILAAYPLSQNRSNSLDDTGSYYHAEFLKSSGNDVILMISLDSVGRYTEEMGSQKHPYKFMSLLYPEKGNYIHLSSRLEDFQKVRNFKKSFKQASELPLYSQNLPETMSDIQSLDHLSFWKQGFPAVLISDTDKYRPSNNSLQVSNRLSYDKMAMLVQGLFNVVMDTAAIGEHAQVAQQKRKSEAVFSLH